MTRPNAAEIWGSRLGLAVAPLFEEGETALPGEHMVLLDGAFGTFAVSMSNEELWGESNPAEWIWSSDMPHHVTVTDTKVAVLRWDKPHDPRVYERSSVERRLDQFYTYLTDDRLRSNKNVVDHLLGFFRRIRSLSHSAGHPDVRTTDVFTAALARLIDHDRALAQPAEFGLAADAEEILASLDNTGLAAVMQEIEQGSGSLSFLRLHPALAVRHAGGQVFQEAHFELLRAPASLDLFDLIGAPEVAAKTRGGTHFTPPALARSLVERVLETLGDVSTRKTLTLCDPACGSGAFLHEALRALRRMGFCGRLHLIGYDISVAAIAMARFVVSASLRDWTPERGVDLDLKVGDSLGDLEMPVADAIVMNPPFIGFGAQTPLQREQLVAALGSASAARGDYSMAFIVRAIEALPAGGALGVLFPASLLSLKAAASWRNRLLELGGLRLLASIGDFGLFSHALVQVACAVVSKSGTPASEFTALITENDPRSTSAALRHLRKEGAKTLSTPVIEDGWSLFPVPGAALRNRPTWRFPTPSDEKVLRSLGEAALAVVGDLFEIAQGVQTGLNDTLLLPEDRWQSLPPKEREYFRLATKTDSIQNGRVVKKYFVFFPHTRHGPLFADEDEVRSAVPNYFRYHLFPNAQRLQSRAAIVRSRRSDWWGLMHSREWAFDKNPRIISKFFGSEGGLVGDYEAIYLPVMGHVWLPTAKLTSAEDTDSLPLADVLAAYVALFNSTPFVKLLSLYAPHVAGGQFDLSSRHVSPVPVPNLQEMSIEVEKGRAISELAAQGRQIDLADSSWRTTTAGLVDGLYGVRLLDHL
jgi:adenine-specific DNA-methyltransferase